MPEPSGSPPCRPTLADVAAHAGVSVPLVSIVMRNVPGASAANREKVRRAAEQLGYRPDSRARLLRSSRSRLIGVVFGVQHAFHGDLVSGLYAAAASADYELALSAVTPSRDEREAIAGVLQDRCEALILLGPQVPTAYLADLATRMPVVIVARAVRHRAVDVVRTDDAAGLHQAVDHLVGLGHSRIAHIDGGRAPGAAERRRGYREALQQHGLTDAVWILPGGLTEDDGAAAAQVLLGANPRPTAVTVFNDRCATGALDVLWRAGLRVPDDMSVVGFDDSRLAHLSHVALTTVAQDAQQITTLAIARAIARLDGTPIVDRELVIPPHLVVRSTTAPPASAMPDAARGGRSVAGRRQHDINRGAKSRQLEGVDAASGVDSATPDA
jgi:DNA-binding LacI/PurR family transcriptional regulator